MKIYFHLNLQYLFLFISFILFDYITENNFFQEKSYKYFINPSIQISLIILFFFELIISKNENKSSKRKRAIIFEKEKNMFPKYKIITLIICDNIFNYISSYTINKKVVDKYAYFFDIIFVFIIDVFIFKKEMHNHHFLSTILNIISCVVYIILFSKEICKLFISIYILINCYSFYFSLILIKYLNTKYFVNIYLLGSFFGIVRLIARYFERYYFKIDTSEIIFAEWYMVILYCIVKFIWNYLYFLIVYKLDSPHIVIFQFIVISLKIIDVRKNITLLFTTLVSIISGLIYTEILELNFCKLNVNTKVRIDDRAKIETQTIFKEMNILNDFLNDSDLNISENPLYNDMNKEQNDNNETKK